MNEGEIPAISVDAEALYAFLISDRSPPDSMMLSDLDGFLTGVAIGPELVMPSEWLPIIWGGGEPAFTDESDAQAVLGGIMSRYNEILRQVEDGTLEPIFWVTPDGTEIAADWAEGFLQAIGLRVEAWQPLFESKRGGVLLFPILALTGDAEGQSLLDLDPKDEDRVMAEATEALPACIMEIAAYWRRRQAEALAARFPPAPGRNAPCPCGSGKKFKKCCGGNA